MKEDEYRQRIRRHRPSSLLPLIAAAAARSGAPEQPQPCLKSPSMNYTPWAKAVLTKMPSQNSELQHELVSPERIRATWSGTASVEDAAQAFGMSRSKGYDPVRRGEFPCRVLLIVRAARVVSASPLRVPESGEPEYNGAVSTSTNPS
ncbi:hypothetical protein [Streptomyces tropicalis]|uniref:Helix-turn-helix domain-containing protein n=1 Tax=Streptomyces tropicalis TaxID=3034234 RepID=A0ABT6A480_9ACTN|nr:hypothetical protein [Streptomyces tropicalis]MDF3299454.1 hypothetical protein [Streptomyces tropicalis]